MKTTFSLIIALFMSLVLFAQEDESWECATDSLYDELIKANPELLLEQHKLRSFIDNYVQNGEKSDDLYVIPVVFHVVHYHGVENISRQQIEDAVDFMNMDYGKMRIDTASIVEEFKNIAADCKIEFRLAKKDPYGDCSIGIVRTFSEVTFQGGSAAKDISPTWPPEQYLNIWVVNSFSNGAAGWSYYPGTAPYGYDGIILLHNYVGPSGTSSYSKGSVLTHEAGHYFNLAHPWGSTNDPGISTNCDIDDGIADTPNSIGHTSCSLNAITCGSLDNVQNFMEYSYCTRMFTNGQAEEMRGVLNSSVAGRNNLHTVANLIATGTNDDYVPQVCAPIADFISDKNIGCTGYSVHYNDITYGTDYIENRTWSFSGGEPSTSIDENPEIIYNTKGVYDAELYVENPTDSDTDLLEGFIRVYDKNDGYTLPYTESFETNNFPLITGNDNNDFYLKSFGDEHWEQTNYGFSGKAIKIKNKGNEMGDINRIYLPNIYIEDDEKPIEVSLKVAYGRSGNLNSDRLKFFVSTSCGDTLRIVHLISGSTLISVEVPSYTNYTPQASHWKTHSFVINSSLLSGNNLRLIIESEAGEGNALYVDDISFSYYNSVEQNISNNLFSAYPNPFSEELFIENLSSYSEYQISIFDMMGRLIFNTNTSEKTYDASNVFQSLSNGLYLIKIQSGDKTQIIKVNKN